MFVRCQLHVSAALSNEYGVSVGHRRYGEKKYLLARLSAREYFIEISIFHAENRTTVPRLSNP